MFFFLFKQKTAYEMRISDWSSDVCSSDLCSGALKIHLRMAGYSSVTDGRERPQGVDGLSCSALLQPCGARKIEIFGAGARARSVTISCTPDRSVARCVGKEFVSTCRSRLCPYHKKKKNKTT